MIKLQTTTLKQGQIEKFIDDDNNSDHNGEGNAKFSAHDIFSGANLFKQYSDREVSRNL